MDMYVNRCRKCGYFNQYPMSDVTKDNGQTVCRHCGTLNFDRDFVGDPLDPQFDENFDIIKAVETFHKVFSHPINNEPINLKDDFFKELRELRRRLDNEETFEYLEAELDDNMVEIADAIGDRIFVLVGTALCYGIPLRKVLQAIFISNMSKLSDDGLPIKREDGKIMKGPNFVPPTDLIRKLLAR